MFTRKSENEDGLPGQQSAPSQTAVHSAPAPSTPEPRRAKPPVTPQPPVEGSGNTQETIISSDLTIIGNVSSNGNVKLDGVIHGDMYCSSLVVSENGEIKGGIVANDVVVLGRVFGCIRGKRVMLHSSAHVEGDIFHQGIGIEMGTRYDGSLKWTEDPQAFVPNTQKK